MAQQRFSNIRELAAALQDRSQGGHYIVSVDGTTGSGKTHLAAAIAGHVGAEPIELDTFLDRNKGGFVDFLNYDQLRQRIDSLAACQRPAIVEGICVDEVLHRIGKAATLRIYVKRLDAAGNWTDEELFDPSKTAEQVIREEEGRVERWRSRQGQLASGHQGGLPATVREVVPYHYNVRPHQNAEYVFEWTNDPV